MFCHWICALLLTLVGLTHGEETMSLQVSQKSKFSHFLKRVCYHNLESYITPQLSRSEHECSLGFYSLISETRYNNKFPNENNVICARF